MNRDFVKDRPSGEFKIDKIQGKILPSAWIKSGSSKAEAARYASKLALGSMATMVVAHSRTLLPSSSLGGEDAGEDH